jgi:hypothetical protein
MNRVTLTDNYIRFIIWLIIMIERSGLSCEACNEKFMIRHISGLPLNEEISYDITNAIRDEAGRLDVSIDVSHLDGKIWLSLSTGNESEN